jgi:hypothetical protein
MWVVLYQNYVKLFKMCMLFEHNKSKSFIIIIIIITNLI